MKKLIALFAAALLMFSLTLQPVQAAAVAMLSVFRVGQTRTIQITFDDLSEFSSAFETVAPALDALKDAELPVSALIPSMNEPQRLDSIEDFTAFEVHLPRELSGETPELFAASSSSVSFTLNAGAINEILSACGAQTLLDSAFDGQQFTVTSPPALLAQYENVLFFATQMSVIDGAYDAKTALKSALLSLPLVPQNVRAQLQNIDVDTSDVYLPVIAGFGRAVRLSGADGYIYSMYDLQNMLTSLAGNEIQPHADGGTAVIWAKDGVLYCVAGGLNEFELCHIANSVK